MTRLSAATISAPTVSSTAAEQASSAVSMASTRMTNESCHCSFRLDAGELDDLGPFLGFFRNHFAEIGGRSGQHRAAQVGKPCVCFGIGKHGVDLVVELLDDLGGRVPGRPNSGP